MARKHKAQPGAYSGPPFGYGLTGGGVSLVQAKPHGNQTTPTQSAVIYTVAIAGGIIVLALVLHFIFE